MAADRRIGSPRQIRMIFAQSLVQRVAHAVQALKLKAALAAREFQDGRDGERVMGGELREDARF